VDAKFSRCNQISSTAYVGSLTQIAKILFPNYRTKHGYTMVYLQTCSGGLTGAVMFCVVGGKMSEGINFADQLGRYLYSCSCIL